MKRKKKAFTLIELMATLTIFSIAMIIVSAVLIQGQNLLNKINNRSAIQNEIRTAMTIIESEVNSADEILLEKGMWYLNQGEWIFNTSNINLSESGESAIGKELVRFIDKYSNIIKVYIEENDGSGKNRLIELQFNDTNNSYVVVNENDSRVLIKDIKSNSPYEYLIKIKNQNNSNSSGNNLILLSFEDIINETEGVRYDYFVTLSNEKNNDIEIDINNNNNGSTGGIGTGDIDSGVNDKENNNESDIKDDEQDNTIGKIEDDNFIITFTVSGDWGEGANWQIEIVNKTQSNVKIESISFGFEKEIKVCYQGAVTNLGNGRYKITNYDWVPIIQSNGNFIIYGQSIGGIENKQINDVEIKFKNV